MRSTVGVAGQGPTEPAGTRAPSFGRSSSLELVFDILFVFTITQLARSLAGDHSWRGLAQTVLLVVLLWWTFGSYTSLTRVAARKVGRALLAVGILANFVLALAVPVAFTSDRLVFALSFTVVVGVHAVLYLLESTDVTGRRVARWLALRSATPVVVVAGAVAGGESVAVWWGAAAVVEVAVPFLTRRASARLPQQVPASVSQPDRFVQRHGVLLLVLLVEALLTIGVGLGTAFRDLDRDQVLVTLTAGALTGTLYYAYFGERDDDAAYRALQRCDPTARERVAILSFGYAFALMLLGVDFAVVGVHDVLDDPAAVPALTFGGYLAGGVGAYWLGLGCFRLAIRRGFAWLRIVFGVGLGAFAFVGRVSGLAELVTILAGSLLVIGLEGYAARRRRRAREAREQVVVRPELDQPVRSDDGAGPTPD